MSKRPYFHTSTGDLARAAENATKSELLAISHELTFRKRPSARALAQKIDQRLRTQLRERASGAEISDQLDFEAGSRARSPAPSASAAESKSSRGVPLERPSSDSGKKCNKLHRPKYEPTDEQRSAIDAFRTGKSLKISAFAGAGKTSTLQFLAAERLERGLYLAFNKSIATDAAENFPALLHL